VCDLDETVRAQSDDEPPVGRCARMRALEQPAPMRATKLLRSSHGDIVARWSWQDTYILFARPCGDQQRDVRSGMSKDHGCRCSDEASPRKHDTKPTVSRTY
jgi:hypothetical protein